MQNHKNHRQYRSFHALAAITPLALTSTLGTAHARSLNWEGQTGVVVTPLAYTAASPKTSIGKPILAYHYLGAGEVLGGFHTTSVTVGLAGNAPAYKGRWFGAAAFVLKGPAKSQLILGSEFAQQPREVRDLPGAIVPTTVTYAARIVPLPERAKFNIDFGVAQAAGKILPGVDLKVRHQFALGISYGL